MSFHPLLLFVHVAGVVIWVGGMFFAYVCLRPEVGQPARAAAAAAPCGAACWRASFTWVWGGRVAARAGERGWRSILRVGFAAAPLYQHIMFLMGLVMIAIYVFVYFVPYAGLNKAVAAEDWKAGGAALGRIRQLVGTNLTLGFLTIAMGTLGRWLG